MTTSLAALDGATAAATLVVIVLFGAALRGRSWTLWLAGYAATLITLVLAWRSR